jgi:hypothetical protein
MDIVHDPFVGISTKPKSEVKLSATASSFESLTRTWVLFPQPIEATRVHNQEIYQTFNFEHTDDNDEFCYSYPL